MSHQYYVASHLSNEESEVKPEEIYHVTIMPCFDKKLEASRKDFFDEAVGSREVDCVLTPNELLEMLTDKEVDFSAIESGDILNILLLFVILLLA